MSTAINTFSTSSRPPSQQLWSVRVAPFPTTPSHPTMYIFISDVIAWLTHFTRWSSYLSTDCASTIVSLARVELIDDDVKYRCQAFCRHYLRDFVCVILTQWLCLAGWLAPVEHEQASIHVDWGWWWWRRWTVCSRQTTKRQIEQFINGNVMCLVIDAAASDLLFFFFCLFLFILRLTCK